MCGIPGLGCAGSGGGAPVPLRLQPICGFFAVPLWHGMQPSVGYSWTIAECLSIAAFTLLWPGNTTARFFSSRTSLRGVLINFCVSSMAAPENPSLAILAIFKARCMSDCSSCAQPPSLAIVADMLTTYKELVAASRVRNCCYLNHTWLCSFHWGLWSLFGPFPGTFITKFFWQNHRTDIVGMFFSRTVRTNALFDHGGFPLQSAMNCPLITLVAAAVRYTACWLSSTSIWIDSHQIPCCWLFLLLPVARTILEWESCVILPVATIAARGILTGVRVAAVSHRVVLCVKRLSFGLIRIQSRLVRLFLQPWLAVLEWWER